MSGKVYANGLEVAAKKQDGNVIAAFPDVCLSPPPPPAGPVPVPYPNSSFAKDTQNGSKTVVIGGKPVMLRDESYYQTSPLGNEAATRNFGAGITSHQITGKSHFAAWSMDVEFEGKNVDRHTDVVTSNHGSTANNPLGANISTGVRISNNKGTKCSCCGGDPHSRNQQYGRSISEQEFYGTDDNSLNASDTKFLRNLRGKNSPCKHLLPETGKSSCNKYYAVSRAEKDAIETQWDSYRSEYKLAHGLPPGQPADGSGSVAHRVPKAAGGCAIGDGNLAPTKPECKKAEERLGKIQDVRANVIRRRYGLS
ncbi:MAG TPA: DUF4150 domain-containing protein [Nitrospira sp.]|nr:DUF4150 domain-containing protein [Nitrospira sp.]